MINFEIKKKDKSARTGYIYTQRGNINTPAFMPVGTNATVKAMNQAEITLELVDLMQYDEKRKREKGQ